MTPPSFNGLIQHSFALRIPLELHPQYTGEEIPGTNALLDALFATPAEADGDSGFRLMPAGSMVAQPGQEAADEPPRAVGSYSLLASEGQTTIRSEPLPFIARDLVEGERRFTNDLPAPLDWAGMSGDPDLADPVSAWDGFIFSGDTLHEDSPANDFLVARDGDEQREPDARGVSELLCQLLAHRRSRLFGPSLARGIFNLLLPHALLLNANSGWMMQPALSLFQVHGRYGFRPIFSLTLFMVPVEVDRDARVRSRRMAEDEIYKTIQAGWALASSRPLYARPMFDVSGPLGDYLTALKPSVLKQPLHVSASRERWAFEPGDGGGRQRLTLRDVTEATLFAMALRMVQGPSRLAGEEARRSIGDQVLTALSASRVSSIVVVDERPSSKPVSAESLAEPLKSLTKKIAKPYRIAGGRRYRLDRPFFDKDSYAIGVLPGNRCIVLISAKDSQYGYQESGLLEAGWFAYMAIGAATATGMIRSIYHDIEGANRSKPSEIAEIEREVVVDLHEIYDLDITWETYRHRYRLLRDRLGITRDYEALNGKLQALYRETNTRFEAKTQRKLMVLTAAIAVLSALIVVGTIVTILK